MANNAYFITGTDTGIGKTWATVALIEYVKAQGKSVVGMKPVASGCALVEGKLVNTDALLLQKHASIAVNYDDINPYAYPLPISPHLASHDNPVDFYALKSVCDKLKGQADVVLVEGAGGWYSPLNANQHNGDLAKTLALSVILVVGVRLGCINHAVLTAKAIAADGAVCAGWVANCLQPDAGFDRQVIESIKGLVSAPCLGVLPYMPTSDFKRLACEIKLNLPMSR